MKKITKYTLGLLVLALIAGSLFFKPIKFYAIKYANRFFSENTTPVDKRTNESIEVFDWSLRELEGETLNFEEFRGNVVLINFWATWCPPCIKEMPSLQDLYDSYGDRVTFLFIARDKERNVSRFMEKNGYALPVYFEDGITPQLFYNPRIPSTFIVSREGTVAMAKSGEYDWNSAEVRELLDSLLSEM
ncbi:Thiol-disulfide isomerase or thioredoxin [Muriicola jejuensis]|uniref:Redoxin domain-containing protein n=1 Tax=Muriicola jejuensis TaxID=504488 RepID=A0A6P0UB38_9FLAO|nr:TlpA disulfide reductase family protein [Muriicola jejuensis]NER09119.1 redoxin domain-containing protein [Muriicola jejuensis]SMP10903.1 Thiol-disulfide isomerase or thioredoxin [Muriicola jejuensis]